MKFSAIILVISFLLTSGLVHATPIGTDTVTVEVKGTHADAQFDPAVVKIDPGDVIQFVVREGLHTVTAYHPDNRRPLRMPESAKSFDSGLLKQGDVWILQITDTGVYDYFCLPHERLGHAGRIISDGVKTIPDYPTEGIPELVSQQLELQTKKILTE